MADAKRVNARTSPSPGSSLIDVDDIDEEPIVDPPAACVGNQYIKSMVKLITAWIKK
jgi:hypothetical protein